jgi:ATP-dependent RNA helicase SUPV3L1/SUV3
VAKAEGLLKRPEGPGHWRAQDAGEPARPARAVEADRPGRGAEPRHVEALRRGLQRSHKVVEAWLEKVKHRGRRTPGAAPGADRRGQGLGRRQHHRADDDWRGFSRILHQFGDRWRDAGHVGEKMFAELQPLWKTPSARPQPRWRPAKAQPGAAPGHDRRGQGAGRRPDAAGRRGQGAAAALAGRGPGRADGPQAWSRSCGTPSASRSTTPSSARRRSAQKAEAALGEHDRMVLEASKALEAANAVRRRAEDPRCHGRPGGGAARPGPGQGPPTARPRPLRRPRTNLPPRRRALRSCVTKLQPTRASHQSCSGARCGRAAEAEGCSSPRRPSRTAAGGGHAGR